MKRLLSIVALVVVAGAGVGVFFVMKSKKAKAAAAEKAFLNNETKNVSANAGSKQSFKDKVAKNDSPVDEAIEETPEDGE